MGHDEKPGVAREHLLKSHFQARGTLKKELLQHLRRTRKARRGRSHTQETPTYGRIKDTVSIRERLVKQARKLPREIYRSLTRDRGREMIGQKRFSLVTDIKVCFCAPISPGNADRTNTPTDCCGSTFRKEWISPTSLFFWEHE